MWYKNITIGSWGVIDFINLVYAIKPINIYDKIAFSHEK